MSGDRTAGTKTKKLRSPYLELVLNSSWNIYIWWRLADLRTSACAAGLETSKLLRPKLVSVGHRICRRQQPQVMTTCSSTLYLSYTASEALTDDYNSVQWCTLLTPHFDRKHTKFRVLSLQQRIKVEHKTSDILSAYNEGPEGAQFPIASPYCLIS